MMSRHRGLVWALVLLGAGWLPRTEAEAAGAGRRTVGALVVDATGQVVGRLYETGFLGGKVVMPAGGFQVPLSLDSQRFRFASNRVVFESGDCSGPPLIYGGGSFPAEPGLFPHTGLMGTLLLIEDGPTQVANVASQVSSDTGLCEGSMLGDVDVRPSRVLFDLGIYVPPFTLR